MMNKIKNLSKEYMERSIKNFNHMIQNRKKQLILLTIMMVLVTTIIASKVNTRKNNTNNTNVSWQKLDNLKISIYQKMAKIPYQVELKNTNLDIKLADTNEQILYYEFNDHNLYFIGIDEIQVKENEETIPLKEKINNDKDYIEKIINTMNVYTLAWDGGSGEYHTDEKNNFTNQKIKIFICRNMSSQNKDIYIVRDTIDIPYDRCSK